MNKFIICYGTRPELIKVAPLIWAIRKSRLSDQLIIVNTGQHIDTMFEAELGIKPDHHLGVFTKGQHMSQLSAKITSRLDTLIQQLSEKDKIEAVIGHGDTMTTLCSAQVAFFNKIHFYHVEAGLRSGDLHSPFPEEYIRKTIGSISAMHYAPSELEKQNLINEGVSEEKIRVVGNTINDILLHFYKEEMEAERNTILISIHRKANQNENLILILDQIVSLTEKYPNFEFIWLLHPAPFISETAKEYDSKISILSNIRYTEMVKLYKKCKMVITDSGGLIEESAFLGIPRIIIRTDNERKGLLKQDDTFTHTPSDLDLKEIFEQALSVKGIRSFVYGTGNASSQILNSLLEELNPA